eukprot:7556369-Prorocentrum_lima.AAC.1
MAGEEAEAVLDRRDKMTQKVNQRLQAFCKDEHYVCLLQDPSVTSFCDAVKQEKQMLLRIGHFWTHWQKQNQ